MAIKINNLINQLTYHSVKKYKTRPLDQINRIVLHNKECVTYLTDEESVKRTSFYSAIAGLPGYPYHFAIGRNGDVFKTAPMSTVTWHAGVWNSGSVGIEVLCRNNASLTRAQYNSLVRLCAALSIQLGLLPTRTTTHCKLIGASWLPFGKSACSCPGTCAYELELPQIQKHVTEHMWRTLTILGYYTISSYGTVDDDMIMALTKRKLHQQGKYYARQHFC